MKKINEVSKISGVTKRTLQYYDNKGLMAVHRSNLNYRIYDHESLERIWEILIYREIGFELDEIKKLYQMNHKKHEEVFEQKRNQMEKQKDEVESQIKLLESIIEDGIPPVGFDENKTQVTYVEQIRNFRNLLKTDKGRL